MMSLLHYGTKWLLWFEASDHLSLNKWLFGGTEFMMNIFTLDINIIIVPWYTGKRRFWCKTKLFQVHTLRFIHLHLLIKKNTYTQGQLPILHQYLLTNEPNSIIPAIHKVQKPVDYEKPRLVFNSNLLLKPFFMLRFFRVFH